MNASTKRPIDRLLDTVEWQAVPAPSKTDDGMPYATHSGVLELAGVSLRCYTLNDGRRVFDVNDLRAAFPGLVP